MKQLRRFSQLATQLLLGGAFLAIFLAGPSSQAQADSPSTDIQTADPSRQLQLVAEMEKKISENENQKSRMQTQQDEMKNKGKQDPPEKPEHCDEPPGTCNSTNLNLPPGCTSGSRCSVENKYCGPPLNKKCKTVISGGVCYCGCI